MFWKYNTLSTSEVETFLDKENVNLKELLELDDIIQECKNQNKKLVEYLVSGDVLSNLIDLIIHEPPDDVEASKRFKHAHVAAELLSCEVPQVNEKISCEEALLDKLYSFLETSEAPLNPLLASFFSKAFAVLITRKSEQNWYSYQFTCLQVFEFLKKKEFVAHILKHLATSAISDLLLRLITCVEGTNIKQGLLDWLNDNKLIESIIGLINDTQDRDTHDNASRLLIEILRTSLDSQHMPASERCNDPLLATLENPATVELLLNTMFSNPDPDATEKHTPSESVLVNGICVLLALLENRKAVKLTENGAEIAAGTTASVTIFQSAATFCAGAGESGGESTLSPEEIAQQQQLLEATIASIMPRIQDFTDLLVDPPNKNPVKTTAGTLEPPLGQARLHIAKLVSALLATNSITANHKLIELKTLDVLLDLFFQYSLNNFLHAQVETCVRYALCCVGQSPRPLTSPTSPSKTMPVENCEVKAETESETEKAEPEAAKEGEEASSPKEETCGEVPMDAESSPSKATAETSKPEEQEPVADSDVKLNPILVHLFTDCRLVDRVLSAWEENDNQEQQPSFQRKGYMAHLTRIANNLHLSVETKAPESFNKLMAHLDDQTRDKWSAFVAGQLAEVNERNIIIPVSSYSSKPMSSSEDDDADFRDINFPQESGLQQIYADYQLQTMADNLQDNYGITDDDFNDSDDSGAKRVLRFGLEDSDSPSSKQAQQDIFESFCKTRFTCFPGDFDGDGNDKTKGDDDEDDDDDPWENRTREISFGTPLGSFELSSELSPIKHSPNKGDGTSAIVDASSPSSKDHVACSSSDEDDDEKEVKNNSMDVDEGGANNDDFWADDAPAGIAPVDMDTGNPWDSTPQPSAAPQEEATFAAFESGESDAKAPSDNSTWAAFGDAEMTPAKSADGADHITDLEVAAAAETQPAAEMAEESAA